MRILSCLLSSHSEREGLGDNCHLEIKPRLMTKLKYATRLSLNDLPWAEVFELELVDELGS